jgi:quinoprotein glucose dehydrogenase
MLASLWLTACGEHASIDYGGPVAGWPEVTGSVGGGQYSPLTQINRDNVEHLKVAWTYDSPDVPAVGDSGVLGGGDAKEVHPSFSVETTPILFDDALVFCTPFHRVVALDAETGKQRWTYDPKMDRASVPSHACRGVASWTDATAAAGSVCRQRVISTSGDGRLFAVDLRSGRPCDQFGDHGVVDLKANLGELKPRELYHTSPPLIAHDLVIIGGAIRDGFRSNVAGGVVRAFDARSGRLTWAFDPVGPGMTPVTAEDAADGAVFTRGTPNVWSFMSADLEHGLVYLPMGNAAVDFYKGAERPIDYYGSSVVALKIDSGEVAWRFKTVNHDIWDYDIAAQPILYEHGGKVPAIAVATKSGNVFLLNRLTGEPIFRVEERLVPATDVPRETVAATQPFPTKPQPLSRAVTEQDVMDYPIWSRGCRDTFLASRHEGMYTPPSLRGTLQSPGVSGGFNWGSTSIDPEHRVFIGVYLDFPWVIKLEPRNPPISGDAKDVPGSWADAPQYDTPYSATRIPFLSQKGVPCTRPPWGELVAIDLDSGDVNWRRPIGSLQGRVPIIGHWLDVGAPVSGGVLQTAGGIAFAGATIDEHLRAFDTTTGKTLWSVHLPYSTHAIPMTYRLRKDGKQYLVVATGGANGIDVNLGNRVIAYTLAD